MHGASLYLIGNQKFDHVWRLDLSQPDTGTRFRLDVCVFGMLTICQPGLEWTRDEHKTFPRPNTKPTHQASSPRTGFSWNNSLILIG